MNDVIFHAFNWNYQDLIRQVQQISDLGYGAILIPPSLYSDVKGDQRWQRYQPKDYRVLLSYLGGKKDLQQLIDLCRQMTPPLKVYADLVLNHMANENREDHYNFPGKLLVF